MLWSAHRGALSIRAEYMRSRFGDGQSWRFEIDEMSFLDSVYKPGNQLHARLPVFTSQAITKQAFDFTSFYLPTIAKTVTACSNVLESALHGNKSYNSYSQPARFDLLPHYLFKE